MAKLPKNFRVATGKDGKAKVVKGQPKVSVSERLRRKNSKRVKVAKRGAGE